MIHRAPRADRGFSMIEAIICVVVLALAVPPSLELLASSSGSRADAVNTARAVRLAEIVLETCLADVSSDDPDLGYQALEDESAYESSLRQRIAALTAPFQAVAIDFELAIGEPMASSGTISTEPNENLFRTITVTVLFPSARGEPYRMPVSVVVGGA